MDTSKCAALTIWKSDKEKEINFTEIYAGILLVLQLFIGKMFVIQEIVCARQERRRNCLGERFSLNPGEFRALMYGSTFKFPAARPYQNHTWIPPGCKKVTFLYKLMYFVVFCFNLNILQWYRVYMKKMNIKCTISIHQVYN